METIFLKEGMKVKIINDVANFPTYAGLTMTITKTLPNFDNQRAFELDGVGIFCIEDFSECVDYPNKKMI